jgi:hypothetical protein
VKSLQCEPPKILTHSLGTRLHEVYNDPRQLLGVGGRWSAGLPFWTRKVLANGGKAYDNACAKVSQTVQLRVCRPALQKYLAAAKYRVSAGISSW